MGGSVLRDAIGKTIGKRQLLADLTLAIAAVSLDLLLFSRLAEDPSRASWITSEVNPTAIVLVSIPAIAALVLRRRYPTAIALGLAAHGAILAGFVGTRPLLTPAIALYTASARTPRRVSLICLTATLAAHGVAVAYEGRTFFVEDPLGVFLVVVFFVICDTATWGVGQLSARARQREAHLEELRDTMTVAAKARRAPIQAASSWEESRAFISYRKDDTGHAAGRLGDELIRTFGRNRIFIDIVSIEAGEDFRVDIADAVANSSIMLVVIGRNWLKDRAGRRRLNEVGDVLRLEVEQALQMEVRIVPVLVDDAEMPTPRDLPESLQPLLRRNAVRLNARTFHQDTEELIGIVADHLGAGGST